MPKNYYSLHKLGKPYGLTCSKMAGIGLCSLLLCSSPVLVFITIEQPKLIRNIRV